MQSQGATGTIGSRRPTILVGIGCSSAAVLIFEIVLTRVFAVSQFHHFAFVTVSLALLGFGASGSALTAFPALGRGGPRRWALLAFAQAVTTLGAYALINALPFDSFSIAWDARQIVYLTVNYLALAVPLFFGGAVIGVLLAGWDQPDPIPSHRVYAATLVGAGAGSLIAIGGLAWLDGEGVIVAAVLMAMVAALFFWLTSERRSIPITAALAGLGVLAALVVVKPPGFLGLQLSPYKDLSAALRYPGAETLSTSWNASSRVDHVRSAGIRSLPGLSLTFPGNPPPQDGLTFDGDDLSPIPLIQPEQADFVPYLLNSLPFSLRPGADALILEPRGGLDVLVGLASRAGSIVAVEPNELAIEAVRRTAGNVYDHPRVRTVSEEPRVYIERTGDRYDLIDLALTAPYRPVTSGAYSLAEDYRLTAEAFDAYLSRLEPEGLLAVMRWVQLPPSEETRLIALAARAVGRAGADPARSIVALRGYSTALVLVKPDRFTDEELQSIRAFAESRRFDLIAAPGLEATEANLYNVLPDDQYYPVAASLLSAADPSPVYASHPFDIAPPTDDHPFFGHFFKWSQASQAWAALGKTWQPFGGAGHFVLIALLLLATVAAVLLIVAPLGVARLRRSERRSQAIHGRGLRLWTVAYFGLLGIGFLFVEIPIVQQYILLVGRPTRSLAVVLFALLIASGLGSLWSQRVPWRAGAIALTVAIAAYPTLLRSLTDAVLFAPLELRMIAGGAALLPLGFLMGTMFPKGLAYLERHRPQLVPWAWGINGTTSVISAVASALLALSVGFSFVITLAAVCYGGCALLVRSLAPRPEATPAVAPEAPVLTPRS
ncbi:MAG: hypothetical protein ACE5KX_07190 [Acidimicrobiia bacterium]